MVKTTGQIKEAEMEKRREKARALRYKHPLARDMNILHIQTVMGDIQEVAGEVQWMDIDTLAELLDGEDEAYEFRMEFSILTAEVEQFQADLQELGDLEVFDELFPAAGVDVFGGYLGYDSFEQDYYGLTPYEYQWAEQEAEKRITRMTKHEILETVGICLKIYASFVSLQYRYDCLSSALGILKGEAAEQLKVVKGIEEAYEKAEAVEHFRMRTKEEIDFDRLLAELPQDYWL